MQKIVKVDDKISIFFNSGEVLEREGISEETFKQILEAETEDEILKILVPEYQRILDDRASAISLVEKLRTSNLLSIRDNCIYWDNVSGLSVPQEFAERVIDAEEKKNYLRLKTYKNFWTLMSLNTDEDCRKNLFWFLQYHGLKIAKCGFFVAYRNVEVTSIPGVYTDYHSHTTRIKIGEMVTLPREACDCDSNVECSKGLHCASAKWLKKNYYGNTGIACLVNPANVVAVPHNSEYGKLRTCAYLPIQKIDYKGDDVIPIDVEDGFDCSYVTKVIYEGIMGTDKDSSYKITIPELPNTTRESIQDKLLEIAKECITNRTL